MHCVLQSCKTIVTSRQILSQGQASQSFIKRVPGHDLHIIKCHTARFDTATCFIVFGCGLYAVSLEPFAAFKLLQDALPEIVEVKGPQRPKLPLFTDAANVLKICGKSKAPNSVLSNPTHLYVNISLDWYVWYDLKCNQDIQSIQN